MYRCLQTCAKKDFEINCLGNPGGVGILGMQTSTLSESTLSDTQHDIEDLILQKFELLNDNQKRVFLSLRDFVSEQTKIPTLLDSLNLDKENRDTDKVSSATKLLDSIAYGQLLLTTYRQIKRGILPDEKTLEELRRRLPPQLASQMKREYSDAKRRQPNVHQQTRASLAGDVLKDKTSKSSRLAVLPCDIASQVNQAVRLEHLKDLQHLFAKKFLKNSLRDPVAIYNYILDHPAVCNLASLCPVRDAATDPDKITDTRSEVLVKLKILLGGAKTRRSSHTGRGGKTAGGVAASLFSILNKMRRHRVKGLKLQLSKTATLREELAQRHRQFLETKKQRREMSSDVAKAVASKVVQIETRRQQMQERERKERMKALREKDMESYVKLVRQTKNKRIHDLLEHTDQLLADIGARIETEKLTTQIGAGQDVDTNDIETKPKPEISPQYFTLTHKVKETIRQPGILVGGKLMAYQMAGLDFLVSLYNNNLSGILADEMGLGKTIQTIALVAYLKEFKNNNGPHLVAVPLSTLPNWASEFQKWCPSLKVLQYRGNKNERRALTSEVRKMRYNVLLTTFEYILREKRALCSVRWKFVIVDEGHKMKNVKSKFHSTLGDFRSTHRLLLTGTPLQNNLNELWSLLNFLMPHTFSSSEDFEKWFEEPFKDQYVEANREDVSLTEEEKLIVINRLHLVLRPFLLRRVKSDVLSDLPSKLEFVVRVQLSRWQQMVYEQLVNKCLKVRDSSGKITSKSVANVIMQLRKVVNHPYLFLDQYRMDDDIWRVSGKFEVLDRMLPKLLEFGHKILIFCQMTSVMDILGDYFEIKGLNYHRLDGSMNIVDRQERMDDFNDPESQTHIFVLSTRAGGLGLNLQAADTVILFDSDWNPHADLQAQARAHRVGQKREVRVFRFVTVSPIEELILAKAQYKLSIDEQIIQAGMFSNKFNEQEREEKLRSLLTSKNKNEDVRVTTPQELIRFMARSAEEEEAFSAQDLQLFGDKTYHQFFEHDDTLDESEGMPSQSGSELPDTLSEAASSVGGDDDDHVQEFNKKLERQEASRTEDLLIQSKRLIGPDEIPSDILLNDIGLPKDTDLPLFELGVRRSRLRASASAPIEDEEDEEEEEQPQPVEPVTSTRRSKRSLPTPTTPRASTATKKRSATPQTQSAARSKRRRNTSPTPDTPSRPKRSIRNTQQ